jgi:hypothetical protein
MFNPSAKALPSHGGRMLCFNIGDYAFQTIFTSDNFLVEDESQAFGMANHSL